MAVKIACLLPHPPILIPEIGGKEINRIQATVAAMKALSEEVARTKPQTCVFISPHGLAFADAFAIKMRPSLSGSMSRFGASELSFSVQNDIELADKILDQAKQLDIPLCEFDEELVNTGYTDTLDHGILIPLYYLGGMCHSKVISLSISDLSYFKHYLLGLAVQKAADGLGRDIAFMASGDLSHRLTPDAPGGYNEKGKDFDQSIKSIFQEGSFEDFFAIDKSLINAAGECGLRSLFVLGGTLNGYDVSTKVLSYEGPFGVGYMVALAEPLKREKRRDVVEKVAAVLAAQKERSIGEESAPVRLARCAVETFVKESRLIRPPDDLPRFLLDKRGGVFVSLKKNGVLRGCIGTTAPTEPSLAEEIIKNSMHAATRDPRFPPVQLQELVDLSYTVDLLGEPEKIADESFLDPKNYGVIVESGFCRGLLLPDIEGVDTVEDQVAIAKQKAGIRSTKPLTLYRFKVTRYK